MIPIWDGINYYPQCIKRWPDRFIGVAELDYDLTLDDKQLEAEVRKLTKAVEELGHKGLFLNHARTCPFCGRPTVLMVVLTSVGNQQKWDTFVKERSGGNGSVVGLPEQVVVAFAAG